MNVEYEIVNSIMKVYNETSSVVKINDKESEKFWLNKEILQGCQLSSQAFNIYFSDL